MSYFQKAGGLVRERLDDVKATIDSVMAESKSKGYIAAAVDTVISGGGLVPINTIGEQAQSRRVAFRRSIGITR